MTKQHQPVLLKECMTGLNIKGDGKYIDATFGRGGHSREILEHLGPSGRLLAFDKDPAAILTVNAQWAEDPRFAIRHASFNEMATVVESLGWLGQINGVLLDLGVSSPQLDEPERGFSFTREGPLDMRMNPNQGQSAAQWLNTASSAEIALVLRDYGEERFAKRIANAIVEQREQQPFTTTTQLSEFIKSISPTRETRIHPATRTFQAIRIFINNELIELRECLAQCLKVLAVGGRLCVISFHSLEDRIVKNFIRQLSCDTQFPPDLPIKAADIHLSLRKVGKLIRPDEVEIRANPRARSARLRIAEKLI